MLYLGCSMILLEAFVRWFLTSVGALAHPLHYCDLNMKITSSRTFLPILLASVLNCVPASPQSVAPEIFGGLKYRLIGPYRGGRVAAVAGIPGNATTFYFGAVDGGAWKTTDAGMVWTPIFEGQPVASIGALAVAPSDPNVIYAGTGEADIRSNLASGDGVYKSTDAGQTWHNVGLHDSRQISRIAVDPRDANVVYAGVLGHAYGPNNERGVFKSSDGGAHICAHRVPGQCDLSIHRCGKYLVAPDGPGFARRRLGKACGRGFSRCQTSLRAD